MFNKLDEEIYVVAVEFEERLSALAAKIKSQRAAIKTEEATKNAFVMPFISTILGYDVFNPLEVVPEFIADVGVKKGEKIGCAYLIFKSKAHRNACWKKMMKDFCTK